MLDAVRKNDLITYTMTITNSDNGIVSGILLIAQWRLNGDSLTSVSMILGPQAAQNAVVWAGNLHSAHAQLHGARADPRGENHESTARACKQRDYGS